VQSRLSFFFFLFFFFLSPPFFAASARWPEKVLFRCFAASLFFSPLPHRRRQSSISRSARFLSSVFFFSFFARRESLGEEVKSGRCADLTFPPAIGWWSVRSFFLSSLNCFGEDVGWGEVWACLPPSFPEIQPAALQLVFLLPFFGLDRRHGEIEIRIRKKADLSFDFSLFFSRGQFLDNRKCRVAPTLFFFFFLFVFSFFAAFISSCRRSTCSFFFRPLSLFFFFFLSARQVRIREI